MIIAPYVNKTISRYYFSRTLDLKTKENLERKPFRDVCIFIDDRGTTLIPFCINKLWKVSSGRRFRALQISEDMIGFKVGEFLFTRAPYKFKPKRSKSKNKR